MANMNIIVHLLGKTEYDPRTGKTRRWCHICGAEINGNMQWAINEWDYTLEHGPDESQPITMTQCSQR